MTKSNAKAASTSKAVVASPKAPETKAPEATTEVAEVKKTDIYADLPTLTSADFEIRDLTGVTEISDPLKYASVHAAAMEAKLHMKAGWKFRDTVFKVGSNRNDKKAGTVMGTIQQIVRGYGAAGCPAPVLVSRLRQEQTGNKRSHYCTALPPVGWAEGYVAGAMNEALIKDGGKIEHDLDKPVAAPAEEAPEAEKKAANG